MGTSKLIYRVLDKSSGKYISPGYKSKSTWQKESWAIAAAETYARQRTMGKRSTEEILKWMGENLELHIFPVNNAVVIPMNEYIERNREVEAERKLKEEAKKQASFERKNREQIKYLKEKIDILNTELKKLEGNPMKQYI